jgi:hypothetical protein
MIKFKYVYWVVTLVQFINTNVTAQFIGTSLTPQSINLVPNSSFEIYDTCPSNFTSPGPITFAKPWFQPYLPVSSTDFYHTCDTTSGFFGVPFNFLGFQLPLTGMGYSGIVLWTSNSANYREYLEIQLSDTLIAGKKYCISMFVNSSNLSQYSTSSFGVYFSPTIITYNTPFYGLISAIPQVSNLNTNIISDTLNWIKIEGDFIAAGDENYLVIGNFLNNASTSIVNNNYGNKLYAYIYIDDVSVYLCDSTVGLNEETLSELILYPNPSRDIVKLNTRNSTLLNGKVNVSNTLGGIMFRDDLSNVTELEIDISKWSNGIYYLTFESVYGSIRRMKLVKGE